MPMTESQRTGGWVLCDVCGGVLYAEDAPRHSTHTPEEMEAAGVLVETTPEPASNLRDELAEAAEQLG